MKNIRYILAGLLVIFLMRPAFSQDQANRNTKADKYFYRGEYYKSVDLFLKMYKSAPTDIYIIQHIADCYRLMNNYEAAEQWYARAVANKAAKPINIYYYYAEVLLRNKKIDQAREQYLKYFEKNTSNPILKLTMLLSNCRYEF